MSRYGWKATVVLGTVAAASSAWADLVLERVASERIFYAPGEPAKFHVVVANPEGAATAGRLRVELVSDLDTTAALTEQTITVEPKARFTWSGSAALKPVLGMAVRATLWRRDGRLIASADDVFSCARSVHQVLLFGRGDHGGWQFSGRIDAMREAYAERFAGQLRATYGNCIEKFAWAPSDFDELTPDEDRWWAGQTGYNECKTNMLAMIQAFHRHGMRVVTYGKAAAGGPVGYERLRRRPDLGSYSNGRFWGNYRAAVLDYMTALGPPRPGEQRMVPGPPEEMEKAGYAGAGWFGPFTRGHAWCDIWYSALDPRVADIGIDELAGAATMFGFDGVRFDGEFFASRAQRLDGSWNAPADYDPEAANVALVRRLKEKCWAVKPGYLFGYNAGTDITWSIGRDNVPASFREKCRDDGLIANEAYAFPGDVPWSEYLGRVRREAEIVRHYGGHYATYAFNRQANNLYNTIFQFGLRAHIMNAFSGPEIAWIHRSATRFSRLLWDDSLRTWHAAAEAVSVTASRPIVWQETAAIGSSPEGGTRYVLHLYNPPEARTTLAREQKPAEPARNVTVTWKGLAREARAAVVDMVETTCTRLQAHGNVFPIGEVPIWKILVVDTDAKPPAPTYDEPPAAARPAGPTAEDLQLTAPKPAAEGAWKVVVEPEQWGGGEATAYRRSDPDALNGGAVVGLPANPPGLMAYTYEYPRLPGRYRASFRLKVADNTVDQPVFRLVTDRSVQSPFPGVGGLYSESKVLKAKDFGRPNQYQIFTAEFDYADYGFMGVSVVYLGHVPGWWDRLVVELVRPWTDQELADHYRNFKRPDLPARPRRSGLEVLVVRGLYNRLYRIDDAIATLTGATRHDAYTAYHPQQGTTLAGYPWTWEGLWKLDLVILANVETKGLNYGQVLMLAEWIRAGGGLVILGGNVTLGQDDNMARAWPLFLPVVLAGPWEIRPCDPPLRLPAGEADARPAVVLYRHQVKTKEGATVLLKSVEGESLLVGGAYGQGRVVVFTGTVLGEAPAGRRPFWETAEWTRALARGLRWASGRREPGRP